MANEALRLAIAQLEVRQKVRLYRGPRLQREEIEVVTLDVAEARVLAEAAGCWLRVLEMEEKKEAAAVRLGRSGC